MALRPSPTKPNHTCSLDTVISYQSTDRLYWKGHKRFLTSFGNNLTWSCHTQIQLPILSLIFYHHVHATIGLLIATG